MGTNLGLVNVEGSSRLGYTGLGGGLEHLKVDTRLRPSFVIIKENTRYSKTSTGSSGHGGGSVNKGTDVSEGDGEGVG
jgi:hypothetical protein